MKLHTHSTARDMTEGSILRQMILFALPLMLGNVFQMLYNTVDSVIVGNFVSKQALAAIGSTTVIVNMMVFFFNGFSIGAGVVIGQYFGARDMDKLHRAIETTMAATFVLSLLFSLLGVALVRPLLRFMSTPEDVLPEATVYLRIYLGGISGLLIYNMGSGILRAVGDSTRPLYFLILTSLLNIVLDLFFVLVLKMGVAGAAVATVLSQFVSGALILILLSRTRDIYRLVWRELKIELFLLKKIFAVGLPMAIQQVLTAFSNIFVQGYVNVFGSDVMAGWSSYNKLDQFIMHLCEPEHWRREGAPGGSGHRRCPDAEYLRHPGHRRGALRLRRPRCPSLLAGQRRYPLRCALHPQQCLLPALQLREPRAGRCPPGPGRFRRTHDYHALLLCGRAADLSLSHHPPGGQHPAAGGPGLSRGLDPLLHRGAELLLPSPPAAARQGRGLSGLSPFLLAPKPSPGGEGARSAKHCSATHWCG